MCCVPWSIAKAALPQDLCFCTDGNFNFSIDDEEQFVFVRLIMGWNVDAGIKEVIADLDAARTIVS